MHISDTLHHAGILLWWTFPGIATCLGMFMAHSITSVAWGQHLKSQCFYLAFFQQCCRVLNTTRALYFIRIYELHLRKLYITKKNSGRHKHDMLPLAKILTSRKSLRLFWHRDNWSRSVCRIWWRLLILHNDTTLLSWATSLIIERKSWSTLLNLVWSCDNVPAPNMGSRYTHLKLQQGKLHTSQKQ